MVLVHRGETLLGGQLLGHPGSVSSPCILGGENVRTRVQGTDGLDSTLKLIVPTQDLVWNATVSAWKVVSKETLH